MPESWLNMPIETARKMGTRYLREKSGSLAEPCRWFTDSAISARSLRYSGSPVPRRTSSASCMRPLLASQRGVSGMVSSSRQKAAAGIAAIPSFHRHSDSPNPMVPMM